MWYSAVVSHHHWVKKCNFCVLFTFWHVCAITCSVTVGLEYVTEIQVIGQSPRYHCELCDSKFDHNLKFPHLVGSKHRFNVLVSNVDLWNSKGNCFGSKVFINMAFKSDGSLIHVQIITLSEKQVMIKKWIKSGQSGLLRCISEFSQPFKSAANMGPSLRIYSSFIQ